MHATSVCLAATVTILPVALLLQLASEPVSLSAVPAPRVQESWTHRSVAPPPPGLPRTERDFGELTRSQPSSRVEAPSTVTGTFYELNLEDTTALVVAPARRLTAGTLKTATRAGQGVLAYPVTGPVTSHFGLRFHPILHVVKLHTGTDFATGCGTPVGASAAGTVAFVGWFGGDGYRVVVDHGMVGGHRLQTSYNHLSAFAVHVGDHVQQGQGIALTGTTGYSTACHLHFEVIVDGVYVDPLPYLSGQASPSNPIPSAALITPWPSATPSTSASPTPVLSTPSPSPSATPTRPPTPTPTPTPSQSPNPTSTASQPPAASLTPSSSPAPSASPIPTPSQSAQPAPTQSAQPAPTQSAQPAPTQSAEPAPSLTPAMTPTEAPITTPTHPAAPTQPPSKSPTAP